MDFEEAKKEFLAKIGNKTWTDLADDREAEIDKKLDNLYTPEYLKKWEDIEKLSDDEVDN